jgi:hypothetical protein
VLQISAVHRPKDSEIDAHGKGVGNCVDGRIKDYFFSKAKELLKRNQWDE